MRHDICPQCSFADEIFETDEGDPDNINDKPLVCDNCGEYLSEHEVEQVDDGFPEEDQ